MNWLLHRTFSWTTNFNGWHRSSPRKIDCGKYTQSRQQRRYWLEELKTRESWWRIQNWVQGLTRQRTTNIKRDTPQIASKGKRKDALRKEKHKSETNLGETPTRALITI